MITISAVSYSEDGDKARLHANITTDNQADFPAFIEIDKEYGQYFVTDRADAFLVGILMKAMMDGHDIKCELPVSSELKFLLEHQLIFTLVKYDPTFYSPKIIADTIDTPIENKGAVGTGVSLGLDSFCTIVETYNLNCAKMRLTHLFTFNDGVYGGFYQNNNWNYCAAKLYEKEKKIADEIGLPLISMKTNITIFMKMRADYYLAYHHIMMIMSIAKLVTTYFIASCGNDFSQFKVNNMAGHGCEPYDFLTLYCCSIQNGVRFLLGDGEKDRLEKLQTIVKYPIARDNLQSCLTEYYNCMVCQKCKRNLITMDALGLLDEFSKTYNIDYYRSNRGKYIEWMCDQVRMKNHASDYLMPAYELIKKREPKLIEKYEMPMDKILADRAEMRRQRNVYRSYSKMFRKLIGTSNWEPNLKGWFDQRQIKNVILYGNTEATQFLWSIKQRIGIDILFIVQNIKDGTNTVAPRLPENTVDYPKCDAIIICTADMPEIVRKKLEGLVSVPIYEVSHVLEMRQ